MTMCGAPQYLSSTHITLEHSKTADSRLFYSPYSHSILSMHRRCIETSKSEKDRHGSFYQISTSMNMLSS